MKNLKVWIYLGLIIGGLVFDISYFTILILDAQLTGLSLNKHLVTI